LRCNATNYKQVLYPPSRTVICNRVASSLTEIQSRVAAFRDERGWEQYHDPKSLACALGAEVGELLELLMWLSPEELADLPAGTVEALRLEVADVALYAINLANSLDFDLADAIDEKIDTNAKRVPPSSQAPARKSDAS
jgi:dCTP diphosphatase